MQLCLHLGLKNPSIDLAVSKQYCLVCKINFCCILGIAAPLLHWYNTKNPVIGAFYIQTWRILSSKSYATQVFTHAGLWVKPSKYWYFPEWWFPSCYYMNALANFLLKSSFCHCQQKTDSSFNKEYVHYILQEQNIFNFILHTKFLMLQEVGTTHSM